MDTETKTNVARSLLMLASSHTATSLHDDLHAILSACGADRYGESLAAVTDRVAAVWARPDEWHGISIVAPGRVAHHVAALFLNGSSINLADVGGIVAGSQERHVVKAALRTLALQAEEAA